MLERAEGFLRLIPAKSSDMWEELEENGYDNLGDHFVVATDAEGNEFYVDNIEISHIAKADVVTLINGSAIENKATVYVAVDNSVWILADDEVEIFN